MPEEEYEALESKEKEAQKNEIFALLKEYTRHQNVRLVARGNAAILEALCIAKKANPKPFILIPDQGGWISFQTYPHMLGFDIKTVKTNRGIIDLIDLEKKADGGSALLITSFAGYCAEQSLKYVANICHEHNCLLIEDASGAIGDKTLCNGEVSDIIIGSFGRWKPVNNEYGGFISVKDDALFQQGKEMHTATNFYPKYDTLLKRLKEVKKKLESLYKLQEKVKQEVEKLGVKVLHRNLRGLNVIAKYMTQEEKEKVIEYCKQNMYEYVECPKYIRVDEEAISIELKRLDISKLH